MPFTDWPHTLSIVCTQAALMVSYLLLSELRYSRKKTFCIAFPTAVVIMAGCVLLLRAEGTAFYYLTVPLIATLPYYVLFLFISQPNNAVNFFTYFSICMFGCITLVNGTIGEYLLNSPWANTGFRIGTLILTVGLCYFIRRPYLQVVHYIKSGWLLLGSVPIYINLSFLLWLNNSSRTETLDNIWFPYLLIFLGFIIYGIIYQLFRVVREKTELLHNSEMLSLQMSAMKNRIYTQQEYRQKIQILRHDMRHEMRILVELFRTGKTQEAESVYEKWLSNLAAASYEVLCAEPILNATLSLFVNRAAEKGISLLVHSTLPPTLSIDTVKLSVILSNALENAVTAVSQLPDPRIIRVKLITTPTQIGVEVRNPCIKPVDFNAEGFPVAQAEGHGLGTRSMAAYARECGATLDYHYADGQFIMRLLVGLQCEE